MNDSLALTETEEKIIEAAIRTFVRFGPRKTSMADIASTAGVSRQTLYDLFGSKEELIRASIRMVTNNDLAAVREALSQCTMLSEKLDAYFQATIIKSFELLQTAGDAEDLITGHNQTGKEEIERSHAKHELLVAEILAPQSDTLTAKGLSVGQLAHFIVAVAMGLKYRAKSRQDLDDLLSTLKTSCLQLTAAQA